MRVRQRKACLFCWLCKKLLDETSALLPQVIPPGQPVIGLLNVGIDVQARVDQGEASANMFDSLQQYVMDIIKKDKFNRFMVCGQRSGAL
jgi:hypothetical protein